MKSGKAGGRLLTLRYKWDEDDDTNRGNCIPGLEDCSWKSQNPLSYLVHLLLLTSPLIVLLASLTILFQTLTFFKFYSPQHPLKVLGKGRCGFPKVKWLAEVTDLM